MSVGDRNNGNIHIVTSITEQDNLEAANHNYIDNFDDTGKEMLVHTSAGRQPPTDPVCPKVKEATTCPVSQLCSCHYMGLWIVIIIISAATTAMQQENEVDGKHTVFGRAVKGT